MKDNKLMPKFILEGAVGTASAEYACIYCHEQGNKVCLACVDCLFQGYTPSDEQAKEIKEVWESGVVIRKVPQTAVNFLKVLKLLVDNGDIITGSRVCDKHNQLELILGDKEKEYCVEWAIGDLVKYTTNEEIHKEIERRKQAGLWVEWYDKK